MKEETGSLKVFIRIFFAHWQPNISSYTLYKFINIVFRMNFLEIITYFVVAFFFLLSVNQVKLNVCVLRIR